MRPICSVAVVRRAESGAGVAVPVVLWALYVLGKAAIAAVFLG